MRALLIFKRYFDFIPITFFIPLSGFLRIDNGYAMVDIGYYLVKIGERSSYLMRMFLGEFQPNITEGSRIALPKKLRDQIRGDEVILSRGFEKCIFIYDKDDFIKEAAKQIENPISDSKTRDLKRYMYSGACESAIDAQGRLVLPTNLKEYAGINKKVSVIGAGDHIEMWDFDNWCAHLQNISQNVTGVAENS